MAIVGNKNDLLQLKKVEDEEGQKLAKKFNAIFQLTSSMNDDGINELFDKIAKNFLIKKNIIKLEDLPKTKEVIEEIKILKLKIMNFNKINKYYNY